MAGFQHGMPGPFAGMDLPWLLTAKARQRGSHPFLIWVPAEGPEESWSYGRFHAEVGQLAAGLARRGIGPGDPVLVHLENAPELLLAYFALAELGAIAVLTNTRAAADELAYFAQHSRSVAAITQPNMAALVDGAAPGLRWIAVTGTAGWAGLFADPASRPRRAPEPERPLSVLYTSGTTSRPKGVVWTHANALWAARVNASHEGLVPEDVHQVYLPLFHANALGYSMLATLWAGGTVVLQPKWSTSRFWPVALRHRTTWVSFIWFSLRAVLEAEIPPGHHLRMFGFATSDPPAAARLGVPGIGWWGMTETVSHGIVGSLHVPNRPGAIGRAAPEYDIRILREDGSPVAPGETGSLFCRGVRGVSMFLEYLHDPAATAAVFDAEGWFATGDLVTLLDDGSIQFTDRAKDMLKVGAENVAASEIERVVLGVAGVREAAVVGRAHPMLDEVPVAFITLAEGADAARLPEAVIAACREALADFKVPREVLVIEDMPRATLEKIAKAELRKRLR
ncbi:AMP-binding protein [Belnapia rosea]|uniref:AMP-binding protein n=1 Tax=Belnapia rosea TaxID=938405 RepID=UPI00087EBD39|nr:AMP-binding protein [Belnapia rosea]SDB70267.1 crotonobetaine/carnitine-CoA ligase [Belnapia rosea]